MDGAIRTAAAGIGPDGVWITSEVTKAFVHGRACIVELGEAIPGKNAAARLSVRIGLQVIEDLLFQTGIAVTPDLLMGLTVTMRVSLRLDPRHGLSAHGLEIDAAMTPGLHVIARDGLRQELQARGLYGLQRTLPAPPDIVHLALICPDASAARGDVDAILAPLVERRLLVIDTHTVKFEGPDAANNVAAALETVAYQSWRPRADAVLIVRGGGSAMGMADIETSGVAERIARMPMPVILGIGHAADKGILSEIAWKACTTPTSAAAAVLDLVVDSAKTAQNNATAIAALCRERVDKLQAACRRAAESIRSASFWVLGEQTKQLSARDHDIGRAVALLDQKLLGLDADIDRMAASLRMHVAGEASVFERHLEDLDRMALVTRERGEFLLVTAERNIAHFMAELAQVPATQVPAAQVPATHTPNPAGTPIVVMDAYGAVVRSAGEARGRPLVLHFPDGKVPVMPAAPPSTDRPSMCLRDEQTVITSPA